MFGPGPDCLTIEQDRIWGSLNHKLAGSCDACSWPGLVQATSVIEFSDQSDIFALREFLCRDNEEYGKTPASVQTIGAER